MRSFCAFLSVSKMESQFFGLLTKISCGILNTALYLPMGRFWWMKSLSEKVILHVLAFCRFGQWARTIGLFVRNFSFGLSKVQSSWPKIFCRKLPSLEKKLFCFLLICQRRRLNKTYWRFLKKTSRVFRIAILVPKGSFSWEKKFMDKICFYVSIWDMGQKTAFWQVCLPRLCRIFVLPVHRTILMMLFKKNLEIFFWLSDLWQKKFQPWSWKTGPGSQYFISTCPQEHLMETKICETFEFFHQCRRLSHKFLAFGRNFSCGVVSTGFYLLIGRFSWKKTSEKFNILFFNILHFRTLSGINWFSCRKIFVRFVKSAIFFT